MPELRILIADDHPLVRRGVRDLLAARTQWQVVAEASDGLEAVEKAVSVKPDVAILDFSMPGLNGAEASAAIARHVPSTAVVVLTMHESESITHLILCSGARGLVMKSDADRTLLNAVDAVAEKRTYFTGRASDIVLGGYLKRKVPAALDTGTSQAALTNRETEVLRLLAHGLTSRRAATQLQISIRTVEAHRSNISRKLELTSIADLVRYAIRNGIIANS